MQGKPKTMYMKRISLFSLVLLALLVNSCSDNGKKYSFDKDHHIYYKGDSLTEIDAIHLAAYFNKQGYYKTGQQADVQLRKAKDTFTVNFIVDKAKITPEMESNFILFGGYISRDVFSGKPVVITLSEPNWDTYKNLGYARPPEADSSVTR